MQSAHTAKPMRRNTVVSVSLALLLGSILASCGGGGGGGGTPTVTPPSLFTNPSNNALADAEATFSGSDVGGSGGLGGSSGDAGADGTAGDGGAIRRATVVLTCGAGGGTQHTGTTDDNGRYLIKLSRATCQAPYLVRVIDVGGNVYASLGAETPEAAKTTRINITPLTDKIVSDVVEPLRLGGTAQSFTAASITASISGGSFTSVLSAAKANLVASIAPSLTSLGVTNTTAFDPIKSTYNYDGTGIDAVLESISHTRDPQTGRTILRPKLVSLGTDVVPTVAELSAANPLTPENLNTPTSPSLNFSKLGAWVNKINACLAAAPNSPAGNECDGDKEIASDFKQNSTDFETNFSTLLSEASCPGGGSRCHVQGSTFRNPVLLFTGKYADSTATFNDLAVVEVTIKQPRIGNAYGEAFNGAVEYTKILIFKRDDVTAGLTAGNWVLKGNQRDYDISVTPRYDKNTQLNSARQSNINAPISFLVTLPSGTTGTATYSSNEPSYYSSSIRVSINPSVYDRVSKTWVPAGIRAVRVIGPGLPTPGLVFAPNNPNICGGNTYLGINNDTGLFPVGAVPFLSNSPSNRYRLAAVLQADTTQPTYWMSFNNISRRTGNLTDFSGLPAYSVYQFDILLNNGTTVTEYSRILSSVRAPATLASAQWNDMSASNALVTGATLTTPQSTFTVAWTNNPNAAFIERASVDAEGWASSTVFRNNWSGSSGVLGAASITSRPTSQNIGFPTDPNCTFGSQYPATTQNAELRIVGTRAWQGRAYMQNFVLWRQ